MDLVTVATQPAAGAQRCPWSRRWCPSSIGGVRRGRTSTPSRSLGRARERETTWRERGRSRRRTEQGQEGEEYGVTESAIYALLSSITNTMLLPSTPAQLHCMHFIYRRFTRRSQHPSSFQPLRHRHRPHCCHPLPAGLTSPLRTPASSSLAPLASHPPCVHTHVRQADESPIEYVVCSKCMHALLLLDNADQHHVAASTQAQAARQAGRQADHSGSAVVGGSGRLHRQKARGANHALSSIAHLACALAFISAFFSSNFSTAAVTCASTAA